MVTNPLGSILRQSPFTALQEHMRFVVKCVNKLPDLFEAISNKEWENAEAIKNEIADLESEADRVKHALRENLPKGLFMPVDRRDLLSILSHQDAIADVAEDIAELVFERRMTFPEPLKEKANAFVEASIKAVHSCSLVIEELDELLEIGFRGRELTKVEKLLKKINVDEGKTDKLQTEVFRMLFKMESEMDPVPVIFLYKLIEWIGDLADSAERTGNRLRLMVAK
ncbi:MAG: TIGR00153 family protein [Acidobacteria bacterium]|nr:MAG: TIGR00153 family protein [Acidobacteriota bacterium]PIE89973.1 MAG: TIGR00153 family protein [Acidobacteriota bacterium]